MMGLKEILISVFVFSGLMIGSSMFYVAINDEYSTLGSPEQGQNFAFFNYTSGMYNALAGTEEKIQEIKSQGLASDDVAGWFLLGSLNAVKTLISLPIAMSAMITDLTIALMLPEWVSTMLFGIVLVIIIFGIIYAAIKVKI